MKTATKLPNGPRARKAFTELRKLGFSASYAADVVDMLERARSEMARWARMQETLQSGPEAAKKWLKTHGYLETRNPRRRKQGAGRALSPS